MKRLILTDFDKMEGNNTILFGDNVELDYSNGGLVVVSDEYHCVVVNLSGILTVELIAVRDDDQFDCCGACKNRCYECAQQNRVIKGEDNDPA